MACKTNIIPLFPSTEQLFFLFRHEKRARMARRFQAVYLLRCGQKFKEVAIIVGKSVGTISRWAGAFLREGLTGLQPKRIPGRSPRLTPAQKAELDADLQKNPRDLGYDFSNWDGKRFMYHIEQKFGVRLKVRSVQVLMRELGYTLQRPRCRSEKTSKPAEAAWKVEFQEKKSESSGRTTSSCSLTKLASSGQ